MTRLILALSLIGTGGLFLVPWPHAGSGSHAACCGPAESCCRPAAGCCRDAAGLLGGYFKIWNALGKDEMKGIAAAREELVAALSAASKAPPAGIGEKERDLRARILATAVEDARKIEARDLKTAREAFGTLSVDLRKLLESFPADLDAYVVYCDMAKKSWLQDGPKVLNPYYGASMAGCGRVVHRPGGPAGRAEAGSSSTAGRD